MKKTQRDRLIVLLLVSAVVIVYLVSRPAKQSLQQQTPTSSSLSKVPQTFHGIPPEGSGGDPILNRQKNRWAPPDSVRDFSIADIFLFPHQELDIAGKKHRDNWSASAIAELERSEQLGAKVEGYLIAVKQTGPETCNGKNDSLRDFHIWIGTLPEDAKSSGLIVEMTPYYKELHPEWRLRYLQALCERHSKVRVSGWVFWDEEHPEEVDKSRGSQWEIHPVTRFEVYTGGSWSDLREDVSER